MAKVETEAKYKGLVILIIDMQEKFLWADWKKAIIPHQVRLCEFAKEKNIPVIVVECQPEEEGKTDIALMNCLQGYEHFWMLTKEENNAFTNKRLRTLLSSLDITMIALAGVNAPMCVKDTHIGAMAYGYHVVTSSKIIEGFSYGYVRETEEKKWFACNSDWFSEDLIPFIDADIEIPWARKRVSFVEKIYRLFPGYEVIWNQFTHRT